MKDSAHPSDTEEGIETLRLVFESVTCDDCGVTVHVGRTCKCGAWTPREDIHVRERRKAVSGLADRLTAPVQPTSPVELTEALDVLGTWVPELFAELNRLAEPPPDGGPRRSIERLMALRDALAAVPRQRPWLAIWDPVHGITDSLVEVATLYLESVQAPDPEQAQRFEPSAQRSLDAAADHAHELSRRLGWWGIDASIQLPGSLIRSAGNAYGVTGAQNIVELDDRGKPIYRRITGKAAAPVGAGVGLLLDVGQIDMAFDSEQFYRTAQATYERLDKNRERLLDLLDDAGWRDDLLAARREYYEARLEAETIIRGLEGQRRMEARALLRLGGKVTENVAGTVVGLVTAAGVRRPLRRAADYTSVFQAARQAGLDALLGGFDPHIRNADAHSDYQVLDDGVLLNRGTPSERRLTDAELVDAVLAAVESSAALFCGLDCLLLETDHPSGRDRLAELPTVDRIKIVMAAAGVEPTWTHVRGDRLELSGTAISPSIRPLTVVASLLPYIPAHLVNIRLHLKRDGRSLRCEVPTEAMRRWSAAEGLEKEAAFVEAMSKSTLNGKTVATQDHVRKFVAVRAAERRSVPLSAAEPDLQILLNSARRVRDHELAASMETLVAAKRATEGGVPASRIDRKPLARLDTYAALRPGPLRDGSEASEGAEGPPLVPA